MTNRNIRTCPVCKEKFYPAPQHVYKTSPKSTRLVCSYHCMLKYRQEVEKKMKEINRRKKNENI